VLGHEPAAGVRTPTTPSCVISGFGPRYGCTPVMAEPELGVGVGARVTFVPAHVDPTVAKHPFLHLVAGEDVVDTWPVDLRDW